MLLFSAYKIDEVLPRWITIPTTASKRNNKCLAGTIVDPINALEAY